MKKRSLFITSIFFIIFSLLNLYNDNIFILIPSIYCSYFIYKLAKDFYHINLKNKNIKNFKPIYILIFSIIFNILLLLLIIVAFFSNIAFNINDPILPSNHVGSSLILFGYLFYYIAELGRLLLLTSITLLIILLMCSIFIFCIIIIYKIGLNIKIIAQQYNIYYIHPIFYLIISILSIFIFFPYSFFMIIIYLQYQINYMINTISNSKEKTQQIIYDEFGKKIETATTKRIALKNDIIYKYIKKEKCPLHFS